MDLDFTKNSAGKDAKTLATDKSGHETLRKAIRCCDGEDSIVLSLQAAMGIVTEWDELKWAKRSDKS